MKYRVHWLLLSLPLDFLRSYNLFYDYDRHNYCFYRRKGYSLFDCFVIVRSSSKCWRLTYVNSKTKNILYFSFRSCREVIDKMYYLYKNT